MQGFRLSWWAYGAIITPLIAIAVTIFIFNVGDTPDRMRVLVGIFTIGPAILAFWWKVLSDNRTEWWNRFEWTIEQESNDNPDWLMLGRIYRGLLEERRWLRGDKYFQRSVMEHRTRCILEHHAEKGNLKKALEEAQGGERKRLTRIVRRYKISDRTVRQRTHRE